MAKKKIEVAPSKEKEEAFWYCIVPKHLRDAADEKRKSVKGSKVSVLMRMIRWYIKPETEA